MDVGNVLKSNQPQRCLVGVNRFGDTTSRRGGLLQKGERFMENKTACNMVDAEALDRLSIHLMYAMLNKESKAEITRLIERLIVEQS